ncbi:MAG: UDP-2,4-diacetamido-2,4,6-trideoxy-beta-L-altropyranose hydrolase [Bacteroidetes bacterium]|nr:UDP-2,4-diacetamido-2,4,6-trideoxy-beta-L-altropyranose hydrolase [Bacteroidota bacterium]
MKVVILTEGSRATGYGHLTRCLSIYQAFEEKGVESVLVAHCDDRGKEILQDVQLIGFNWLVELEKLYENIDGADLLIIDSYLAPEYIYLELSSRVTKAIYIDDYRRIEYPKGVIINGTLGAESFGFETNSHHELLLGAKYIPIRKEFWKTPIKKNRETVQDILITVGGHDKKNISFIVLDIMLHEFQDMSYTLVMGSGINNSSIYKYSKEKNIKILHSLATPSMLDLMLKCDVAISAAGQTLYELARVGVPTIAIGVVENQQNNLMGWVKNKFILDSLWFDDRDFNKKIISSFNSTMMKNHREIILKTMPTLVDGQGARRIVSYLLELNKNDIKTSKIG